MGLATEVWKFLKENVDFVLEKQLFFLCRIQNLLNFRMNIWFPLFCQISEVFCKRRERGVWQLWNLVCGAIFRWYREKKKVQSTILAAIPGANIFYHFSDQPDVSIGFYQPHSTGPHHIHNTLCPPWGLFFWRGTEEKCFKYCSKSLNKTRDVFVVCSESNFDTIAKD